MKTFFKFLLFLIITTSQAQTTLTGKLIDKKQKPISGANAFVEGTYDGATSIADGTFSFETNEKGLQTLVINALGYDELKVQINIDKFTTQTFTLKANINALDAVVITAGTIKAGDNSKASALKPLDILTTAGALGDIVGAFQTMPGAQTVGESGRLFVRGGESDETQTYIDGIRVAQPYGNTAENLPTRGRFSPMLFSGMTFSTGGYSAEFGDALSSVLLLNSINEPTQEKTDLGFMTVGGAFGNTSIWKKTSLSVNATYINLAPYQVLIPQRLNWNKPFQGASGEAVFRHKTNKGLFKLYTAFDYGSFDLNQKRAGLSETLRVQNKNNNLYVNASYKTKFDNGWTLFSGASLGKNKIAMGFNQDELNNHEWATHLKLKFEKKFFNTVNLAFGGDYFHTRFDENYTFYQGNTYASGYKANIGALFAEADWFISPEFAIKGGVRSMYHTILQKTVVEPRASMAYKVSNNSQFSLAFGDFHQAPRQDYLKYESNLNFEKTQHYIFNYMYTANKRTLRAEAYFKNYKDLVKYDTQMPAYNSMFSNSGSGYAKGLDIFWRDNKTFKHTEYWVSYSFIDSERDFKNYTSKVTPSFVANHTLSLVGKYFIEDWKSQVSLTNTFTTGRPYNNPNTAEFMNGRTKNYNSLSASWAYLITTQKILYFSVSNVLGRNNVFGYQYATTPDVNGVFQREAIGQPADRFFFVGFFWTISKDKKTNQLENL